MLIFHTLLGKRLYKQHFFVSFYPFCGLWRQANATVIFIDEEIEKQRVLDHACSRLGGGPLERRSDGCNGDGSEGESGLNSESRVNK